MAFQMSCWYHNRSGRAFTALSWPDTLLPRWAELLHRLRLRYPRWGQEDGGLQEDRSVWVEVGGWEMSIWTIRIRPRMTLSSSLYSSESQAGSSFGVDRDWDMFLCVCVCHRDITWERIWVLADAGGFGEDDGRTSYMCWSAEERYFTICLQLFDVIFRSGFMCRGCCLWCYLFVSQFEWKHLLNEQSNLNNLIVRLRKKISFI